MTEKSKYAHTADCFNYARLEKVFKCSFSHLYAGVIVFPRFLLMRIVKWMSGFILVKYLKLRVILI